VTAPANPPLSPSSSPTVVAIDGPAGSGKSTLGRALAKALSAALGQSWAYLDTGAMYRAVTVEALRRGVSLGDAEAVAALARGLDIRLDPDDGRVTVDGRDVTGEIRTAEVNAAVSTVAEIPQVRAVMRDHQRDFARRHGFVIAEGRDIGSVVFPTAALKVYLEAHEDERVRRRVEELRAKEPATDAAAVRDSLLHRDRKDSGRRVDPLVRADGAVPVDTTGRTPGEVLDAVRALVLSRVPPVAGR
jgi:cytidylate kinase